LYPQQLHPQHMAQHGPWLQYMPASVGECSGGLPQCLLSFKILLIITPITATLNNNPCI
jgi:hypothetical protein